MTASRTIDESDAEILLALRAYVAAEFLPGTDPAEIAEDLDLLNGGALDSLGLLKLIAWIESRFEVGIADADLEPENFRSLASIAGFIRGSRSPQRPS